MREREREKGRERERERERERGRERGGKRARQYQCNEEWYTNHAAKHVERTKGNGLERERVDIDDFRPSSYEHAG